MPQQADYYTQLNQTLEAFDFAKKVRALCAPAYDQSGLGKPGIDPVVFVKMHLIGFLENLPSQRAIALRCGNSLSIRFFLLYDQNETTPDHSSLSVFRKRLSDAMFQQLFNLGLQALDQLSLEDRQAVQNARRSAKSQYGRKLLKRRGMHLERVFAHRLDNGGQRRTSLRGTVNNNKRFLMGALAYNLSQLMRQLFGIGTPKQWAAAKARGLCPFSAFLVVIRKVIYGIRNNLCRLDFQPNPEKQAT